ncbi:MAG: bacillithiol system redox-active protein YtxJ [Gemmatimonadetes bacterium]|uniref:Bacillithiol system redox-active protein YtxJ n=1 Tax=Candidatus Kutchimonas denitrificans TaxID=3056748 RepID=A0AAE5CCX8_9BACT|nr:bacillithiol system redox-active protein YtxJ [Gemmatimonadota bacterium]NIR76638.1 bacillithiol system redox-active protein YtxJ [Candidatus Kutchimonas denitrificans]NIS03407.1 bacillithiol system redox-active protein YtxJ [Gemmatimonadota bacterium]NIT69268.1 bacillithiol system redox-active protein YtxJ [Gemmatimonadota bacterium]NIU54740.1 bacillithiol system redox-active protein YtxJ [Gemmatimonadota bacterium]
MLREIRTEAELEETLDQDLAVIYKHSPICGSSSWARREVLEFVERHPDVPVVQIDVVSERDLSQEVARRLDVRHQSPQAIVIRAGTVLWSDSHSGVSRAALERAVDPDRGRG